MPSLRNGHTDQLSLDFLKRGGIDKLTQLPWWRVTHPLKFMKFRKPSLKPWLVSFLLLGLMPGVFASLAKPKPLKERVANAELVFVGKVVNRVLEGDWVRAELIVEQPLRGVKKGEKIKVIWRKTIGGRKIYDTAEGTRGIALLKDKHEGRYWLRLSKFEGGDKLEKVKEWIVK